jgi:hypothetical protein
LQRSLAERLAVRCFSSVAIQDDSSTPEEFDLILAVVLSDAVEETRFDDSIAGVLQPGEPTEELRRVVRSAVTVDATLSAGRTGAVVYRRHYVVTASRRPVFVGEDPQALVRAEVVEKAVSELTRTLGCGRAKLARKVREALAGSDPAVPGSR